MKLSEAKELFEKCKKKGVKGILVVPHCWVDHPKRGFSMREVQQLLLRKGRLMLNRLPSAKPDSFLWHCRDDDNKDVQIAILFEKQQIIAIAISAYRKPKL